MTKDLLVILGTGTCQIQPHRMASSVLLQLGGTNILFDIGRGSANRLVEYGLTNDDIEHIVLSHFHPDHISDLIPFLHAACWSRTDPRSKDLTIYGPKGLKNQVMRLLSLFPDDNITSERFEVKLCECLEPSLTIAGQQFEFRSLPPAGNHGFRFSWNDKVYAITGDSAYHEAEVEFLRGCDLAVIDSGHLSDDEIVELAARTQVPRIICSHLYRELNVETLTEHARRKGFEGELLLPEDLQIFSL